MITFVKEKPKILPFRHREVFCVLIGRLCSIFACSDLRSETGAAGSGPADRLVRVDKLFHWQKSRLFFFSFFPPSLHRSCCFCIPPNVPDGPLFKSCYLSYWEGMKSRPGVLRWSPRLRKNLPGGLRYSGPLSLPVLWPCWKFRENSAWMKTRSIFTFPLKGFSVLSSSQAYHLPLQTHLEISLATRHEICRKYLIMLTRAPVPGKASVFSDVLFHGVCKITFKSLRSER